MLTVRGERRDRSIRVREGPSSGDLAGVRVRDPVAHWPLNCYSDIGVGTQVRVSDAAGTLLGVGSIAGGVAQWDLGGCQFTSEVAAETSELYQVEVARRGQLASRDDDSKPADGRSR